MKKNLIEKYKIERSFLLIWSLNIFHLKIAYLL